MKTDRHWFEETHLTHSELQQAFASLFDTGWENLTGLEIRKRLMKMFCAHGLAIIIWIDFQPHKIVCPCGLEWELKEVVQQ